MLEIYDLVGNVWEWSLEKTPNTSKSYSVRGASYGSSGSVDSAPCRSDNPTGDGFRSVGFRPTLW